MRMGLCRVIVIAAAGLVGLAGCQTNLGLDHLSVKAHDPNAPIEPQEIETTGTVPAPAEGLAATPELLGSDPNDEVSLGKKYFRQGSYGLAERSFRKAVELHPKQAEAWLGLAASYDRLKRFDLADRSYAQAIRLVGPSPAIMNNQGFSYMLRGDYARARTTLLAAKARDPANPYIQNNLKLLDEASRKRKMVN
jgi:Flp pilus assembly protein TadD